MQIRTKSRMKKLKTKQIKAAGGVVFSIDADSSEPNVLLIYRNKFWDIPKGKLEKGESIAMCASREVAEETHSDIPIIIEFLDTTYHEYDEKNKHIGKTTFWYSMVFPRAQALKPQTEEGIEKIEWVPLSSAIELVEFENLKFILREFKKH